MGFLDYYKNAIITDHYHISSDCFINPRIDLMRNLLYYNTLSFYIDDLSGYDLKKSFVLVSSLDYGQLKINGEDISVIYIFVKDFILTFKYDSLYTIQSTCYKNLTSDDEFNSIDIDFNLRRNLLDMQLISKSINDSFSKGIYLNVLPLLNQVKKECKDEYFIFRNKYIYRIPTVYTFTFLALLKFMFPKELIDIIIDRLFIS